MDEANLKSADTTTSSTFAERYFALLQKTCYRVMNSGSVEATCIVGNEVVTVNIPYSPNMEFSWYKDAAKSKMQVELLQYLFEQEVKSIEDRIRQEGAE